MKKNIKKVLLISVLTVSLLLNALAAYVIFAKNPMKVEGDKSWIDMYTNDADATEKFLNENLGIKVVQTNKENGMDYRVIKAKNGLFPYAGIMQIDDKLKKDNVKPHATVYFTVKDYDKMSKQFQDNGAKVLLDGMVIEGMKFGFFVIPGGIDIAIVQYDVKEDK